MEEKDKIENIDYVECKICGLKKRVLTQHLRIEHNMTRAEYEAKYGFPAVCKSRSEIQVERNNIMNNDPVFIEKMKPIHHENGVKTYALGILKEAGSEYSKSERGRKISSQTLKRLNEEGIQELATKGKKNSELFHDVHSRHMTKVLNDKWSDAEWKEKHLAKMFDGSLKDYVNILGETVKFRSSWEAKFNDFCIINNINISYESLQIEYEIDGTHHVYIPDFYDVEHNIVFEVKPKQFVANKKNQIKKQKTTENGYRFYFVTEKELKDLNSFFGNIY